MIYSTLQNSQFIYETRKNVFGTVLCKSIVLAVCLMIATASYSATAFADNFTDAFTCKSTISQENYSKLLANVTNASEKTTSLTATFSQTSYFLGLDKIEASTGRVSFQKVAKMRWDYLTPTKQLFIMDGENVWFYQPEQNQAIVTDFYNSFKSDVPVSFLLGLGKLSETFDVQSACNTSAGILLTLVLKKSDDSLDKFYLLVRKSDYAPIGVKIIDLGGNETSILFNNLQLNTKINASEFTFVPPKGADIIDNRSAMPTLKRNAGQNIGQGTVREEDIL